MSGVRQLAGLLLAPRRPRLPRCLATQARWG